MHSDHNPRAGNIVKMRSWHGVILDVFKNEAGKTVLQVQTVRNIFRKLGPELIEIDLAPEHITPATIEDLHQEIALHQRMQNKALEKFMAHTNVPTEEKITT